MELTKTSDVTFTKTETIEKDYSISNVKRLIETLGKRILALEVRKADLQKLYDDALKIGVKEETEIKII